MSYEDGMKLTTPWWVVGGCEFNGDLCVCANGYETCGIVRGIDNGGAIFICGGRGFCSRKCLRIGHFAGSTFFDTI